jgi:hypothetical protein
MFHFKKDEKKLCIGFKVKKLQLLFTKAEGKHLSLDSTLGRS